MAGRVLLDAATHVVDGLGGEADRVEVIHDQSGGGEGVADRGGVAGERVDRRDLDRRCQMVCVRGPGLSFEGRTHCGYGQSRSGA